MIRPPCTCLQCRRRNPSVVDNLIRGPRPARRKLTREGWELVCWAVLLGFVLTIFVGLWTGVLG